MVIISIYKSDDFPYIKFVSCDLRNSLWVLWIIYMDYIDVT